MEEFIRGRTKEIEKFIEYTARQQRAGQQKRETVCQEAMVRGHCSRVE